MNTTKAWEQYERGIDYKNRIGLYNTVDLNERFYSGDQWVGIPHEGLPTPVVNFIKYASAWKIAAVTDRRLELNFFAEGEDDGQDIGTYAEQISAYCGQLWERLKMDYLTKEGLKQAAITGDYIQYFYWDDEIDTGQALTGDINTALIDNVNYYPGNPNEPDVQRQPYIILVFRELVSKVKEEAKANGIRNLDRITADEDWDYTSGDRGKVELDDEGKCNVLLKMYKKKGRVYCEKSVKNLVIQKEKETKLKRYPVAMMNWETRKNCCHGVAEVTGLIPNQVYANKILALSQLNQVQTSFPKVIYDKTRIKQWSNKVAGSIPVNGDIDSAARYIAPPNMSYDAWRGLDVTIDQTMRMMGANDVTLGNISNPDNTSAFIATRDAAMVPLQSQQERFYSFIEDIGLIWLDFIQNFYKSGRKIPVVKDGKRTFVPIIDDEINKYTMRLKVDVGPSSMWSEIQTIQTLDNLLARGQITFKQYLQRMPAGHIPKKEELLSEIEQQEGGAGAPMQGGMPGMGGMPGGLPPELAGMMAGGGPHAMPNQEGLPPELAGLMGGGGMPPEAGATPGLGTPPVGGAGPLPELAGLAGGASPSDGGEMMPELEKMLSGEEPLRQIVNLPDELKELSEVEQPDDTAELKKVIEKLKKAKEIDKETADALLVMIEDEVHIDEIISAAATAQEQGKVSMKALKEIEQASV